MLVGRPGLSPVMVGRGAELDRLARLLREGSGTAIALVGGEAGVGKTRLVRELIDRVGTDTVVLAGQADPGALGRPFELFADAVDGAVADDDERLAKVRDHNRSTEDRVACAVEVVESLAKDGQADGRPHSLVVVFDDLHWADSESVAVFERLAERGAGGLLLIGTYRPDSLTRRHPFADALPRLERRHAVVHVHLERLTPTDVGAFLAAVYGRPASYRVVETLHSRTGGNPFFLEELLAAAGEADPDQLCDQPLPWSLSEAVRRQLDDLEPEERRIIEAAAVLGRRVSFDLLATVTRSTEDQLIMVLRQLVATGLLAESESDVFTFRHALAREAIETDLLGRERRRLHEAALGALRESGSADLAGIAHHAQGAGRYDDMVDAARSGARRYLDQGSTHQALQLAELGLTEACDDLELLGMASRSAWLAGLNEDASVHAERWLAVARSAGDLEAQSGALRRLVRLFWEIDDMAAMEQATNDVIALVDQLSFGAETGKAMACVAQSFMLRDRPTEAVAWADRALVVAEELGLPALRAWARCEKGSAMMAIPELAAAGAEMLAQVADEAERLHEWVVAARALNNGMRVELLRPDPVKARAVLTRMRDAAKRAGFDSLAGPAYWQGLADLAEWEGDYDAAMGYIEEGRRRDRRGVTTVKVSWYRVHEAGLALEAGDVARADAIRQDLQAAAGPKSAWYLGLSAHAAYRSRDLAEARDRLTDLVAAATDLGAVDPQLAHDVAWAALASGASADDVRPLLDLGRLDAAAPLPAESPWRALYDAQLLEAEGRVVEAAERYIAATERGVDRLRPSVRGTAHTGAARCLIADGRVGEAKAHAIEAAQLLARWRGLRVEELAAVERRLGLVPAGTTAAGSDGLTPRELEVVALLAEGLTNAELAARLYISPKTAAVHVSNILAKLHMSSRAEAAAYAVREGLV
jgi:DNA-binding CsgD family transcriptional regulator